LIILLRLLLTVVLLPWLSLLLTFVLLPWLSLLLTVVLLPRLPLLLPVCSWTLITVLLPGLLPGRSLLLPLGLPLLLTLLLALWLRLWLDLRLDLRWLDLLLLSLLHRLLWPLLLLLLRIWHLLLRILGLLLRSRSSRLLLFLPLGPALLILGCFKRLLPVRLLVFRFACLAGFSSVDSLLVKDLIDKILLFEEFYPLNFELFSYFPQFGNKHFAQFKNIMHILRMCRK
jgi:hypothetical protein